jgi:acyl-CoA thioester hydrolase
MKSTPKIFETRLRVRYAETDQMGVVYHANYLVWFEVGRVELIRELGLDYKRMELEDDCFVVVVEARVRYKAPARYDDEVVVRTHVRRLRGFVLEFGYQVLRVSDGMLLCTGETIHVVTNSKMEKRSLPVEYAESLMAIAGTLDSQHLDSQQ